MNGRLLNLVNWADALEEFHNQEQEGLEKLRELIKGAKKYDNFCEIRNRGNIELFPREYGEAKIKIALKKEKIVVDASKLWKKIEQMYEDDQLDAI